MTKRKLMAFTLLTVTMSIFSSTDSYAQTFTSNVWLPYQDRYGLIHTTNVDPANRNPISNNGLLYTSEACVIMQMRGVKYDQNLVRTAVASCEVKPYTGLYRHAPENINDQEGPDDYNGLGALAGICGFHDIAQNILKYGEGPKQPSREAVGALEIVKSGSGWLGLLRHGLNFNADFNTLPFGKIVPYNYNNIEPGKFTFTSWLGRFPGTIVHLKIGAGQRPTYDDMLVWSAALKFSADRNSPDKADPKWEDDHPNWKDGWIQSWLMILTYKTSKYRCSVADEAIEQWWNACYKVWPSGIRDCMTSYLAVGKATDNPFSEFIEDFKDVKGSSDVINIGDGDGSLLLPTGKLLSDLSPANFLAPVIQGVKDAETTVNVAIQTLKIKQTQLDTQRAAVNTTNNAVSQIDKSIAELNANRVALEGKLKNATGKKLEMLAKGLDKIRIPGPPMKVIPAKRVFGVPVTPPVIIPAGAPTIKNNGEFDDLVRSITNMSDTVVGIDNQISALRKQEQEKEANARSMAIALADKSNPDVVAVALAEDTLKKAHDALESAKEKLTFAQYVVSNLIPGVPLPIDQ